METRLGRSPSRPKCPTGRASLIVAGIVAVLLSPGTRAATSSRNDEPCAPLAARVAALQPILRHEWLKIRPERLRAEWYRRLDRVPTACESPKGKCLFLGSANVVAGPADRLRLRDCSESFIFNSDSPGGPMLLTIVSLEDSFATFPEARKAASDLREVVTPPPHACPTLAVSWGNAERGRECRWASDGDWVFVLSVNVTPRGGIWETEFRLARSQY